MKSVVQRVISRTARDFASANTTAIARSRDADLVLSALLAKTDLATLNDPVSYTSDLRSALEPLHAEVTLLKSASETDADKRFAAFAELLAATIPSASTEMALRFARVADSYRGMHGLAQGKGWASDVARHFVISSSSGRKGRLLTAAITHFAPSLVLEVGTAYGISGLFIASALRLLGPHRKLVTVEGFEPQATLGRTMLNRETPGMVETEFGLAGDALPSLARTLNSIDLYFHDAGHTYDDYVNDVSIMLPKMASGSILVLDDIRWDDRRYIDKPSRSYEGWQTIVNDPRTRAAIEIDGELGIAMFE